jgi:hypothetical protein
VRYSSLANAHCRGRRCSRRFGRSPGGTRGAHASHTSFRRRAASSRWRRRRRSPRAWLMRIPAAASPCPTARSGGGLHPLASAQRTTTSSTADGRSDFVLPALRPISNAHSRAVSTPVRGASSARSVGSAPHQSTSALWGWHGASTVHPCICVPHASGSYVARPPVKAHTAFPISSPASPEASRARAAVPVGARLRRGSGQPVEGERGHEAQQQHLPPAP